MEWSDIGSLGSLLGAAGVVASLGYLSAQIRLQVRESRVTAVHVLTQNFRDFLMSLAENAELADIWMRGINDFEGLPPTDRLRFSSALGNAFRIFDTLYNYYREGIIDAETWATLERPMEDLCAYPGIQAWWQTRKHWFSAPYQARMRQKIERGSKPKLYGEYVPEP